MKKTMMAVMILLFTGGLFCGDIRVFADFNFSLGTSSFFKLSTEPAVVKEVSGLESIRTRMGFGFKLGATVPITRDLAVVPYAALNYGHRKSDFIPDDPTAKSSSNLYYFHTWTGSLDLAYTYLRLNNGWNLYVQSGLSLNFVNANEQMEFAKTRYLGWQGGLGFAFRQVKNWGFHSLVFFKTLFGSEKISYAGIDAGVFYRL